MTPVYIDGCFGILHPADGSHGVVICGTMGDEALNMYRPLAFLAERFAEAGCPVLRLDYYGAGDSGGEDGESGRFQAWLDGIVAGVNWLRASRGVRSVTLVGARIGAPLVALAACGLTGIDGLILLNPVPSGHRFLREMTLRARTVADIWKTASRVDDGIWFEAYGLRLDRPTRNAVDRLDMASLPRRPAPRALVLDHPDSPSGAAVSNHLRQLGSDVTYQTMDGLQAMMRDPYENSVPHDAFARALAWHRAGLPGDLMNTPAPAEPMPVAVERHALPTGTGIETPIAFGPAGSLFGILSTPAHPRDDAPAVLIASSGANPRSGNSRMAVTLSRWLAANGIASLRMDGAGIGDAALDTGERGRPYAAQGDLDLAAGIDALAERSAAPVLLFGMCSGAFHALRATYDDHRIRGLMLVNLQKLAWNEGESLSVVQRATFRTTRFYLRNAVSTAVWKRLLGGEVNLPGISRALAGRAWRRALAAGDPLISLLRRRETLVGRVRRNMHDLRQRQVPVLYVLSGNDPGLDEISDYFGTNGRKLRWQRNVMFHVLDGADHTFSAHWAREALLELMAGFLRERCGLTVQAGRPVEPRAAPRDARFEDPLPVDTFGSAA